MHLSPHICSTGRARSPLHSLVRPLVLSSSLFECYYFATPTLQGSKQDAIPAAEKANRPQGTRALSSLNPPPRQHLGLGSLWSRSGVPASHPPHCVYPPHHPARSSFQGTTNRRFEARSSKFIPIPPPMFILLRYRDIQGVGGV